MKHEKISGAIVFTRKNNEIFYVIVKSQKNVYGFPKGHWEEGETLKRTAIRETKEETGLDIKIMEGFKIEDQYIVNDKEEIMKHLTLFLAEYTNQKIVMLKEELLEAKLMKFEDALRVLQYENLKKFLKKANEFIIKNLR